MTFTTLSLLHTIDSQTREENLKCAKSARRNETELNERLGNYRVNDTLIDSYFMHPILASAIENQNITHYKPLKQGLLFGYRRCTRKMISKGFELMSASSCPWYIVLNIDEDRYPTYMATAKCRCKRCYKSDGTLYKKNNKTEYPRCKPLNVKIKVLRQEYTGEGTRQCDSVSGHLLYEESYEDITVGCVCAYETTLKHTQGRPPK